MSRWACESRAPRSGFYNNQPRSFEMVALLEAADFAVEPLSVQGRERPAIERSSPAKPFRELTVDDLLRLGFDALLPQSDRATSDHDLVVHR